MAGWPPSARRTPRACGASTSDHADRAAGAHGRCRAHPRRREAHTGRGSGSRRCRRRTPGRSPTGPVRGSAGRTGDAGGGATVRARGAPEVVMRPVREARDGIRQAGEAVRQPRDPRRGPRVSAVSGPPPHCGPLGRWHGAPEVVEPVEAKTVGADVTRDIVGRIAGAGEMRGPVDRCGAPVRGHRGGGSYRNGQDDGSHQQTGGDARTESWSDHSAPPVPSRRVTCPASHVMRFTASWASRAGYRAHTREGRAQTARGGQGRPSAQTVRTTLPTWALASTTRCASAASAIGITRSRIGRT